MPLYLSPFAEHRQNGQTRVQDMNQAYVLVAIILCVWLLVKLLPGMEP